MFNRANEGFKKTLQRGASASEERPDLGQFEAYLDAGEDVQHVLRTDSGIEHETPDRTTIIEPGGDTAACTVVTNTRVVVFLGDDPEITYSLGDIVRADVRESILSATFEFGTVEETIRFDPVDADAATEATRTINVVGQAWEDLEAALASVRDTIAEIETQLEAGEDPSSLLTRARSRLSKAHHCAARDEALPSELMRDEINPVEADLDRLRVRARVDHVEDLLTEVESAGDADELADAYATFREASEVMTALESVVAELPTLHGAIAERVADVSTRTEDVGQGLLDDALATCATARDADEPADAVAAWAEVRDHYSAALAAGWDGELERSADALRYQLSWVVGQQIDALTAQARELERAGDRDDGDDTENFESAKAALERAREMAGEHPHAESGRFAESLERIEGKIERSQWQWGGVQE